MKKLLTALIILPLFSACSTPKELTIEQHMELLQTHRVLVVECITEKYMGAKMYSEPLSITGGTSSHLIAGIHAVVINEGIKDENGTYVYRGGMKMYQKDLYTILATVDGDKVECYQY